MVPIFFAFFFAEVNSLGLVTSYIPSTIRTTFRFRYGGLGSLHDPEFQKMRRDGETMRRMASYGAYLLFYLLTSSHHFITVEQATFIFGSMFWGCFISK